MSLVKCLNKVKNSVFFYDGYGLFFYRNRHKKNKLY